MGLALHLFEDAQTIIVIEHFHKPNAAYKIQFAYFLALSHTMLMRAYYFEHYLLRHIHPYTISLYVTQNR